MFQLYCVDERRKLLPQAKERILNSKICNKNIYGPQVFVDKNISMAYEPGSIFKAFTVAIGLDTDEIRLYDFYHDPGEVKVWPYTIKNADNKNCMWDKSFMNAFTYSCNIWMVRIESSWEKQFL